MTNTSIFAAFERMWHHIVTALEKKVDKTTYNTDVDIINNSLNSKAVTLVESIVVPVTGWSSYDTGAYTTTISLGYNTKITGSDEPIVDLNYDIIGNDATNLGVITNDFRKFLSMEVNNNKQVIIISSKIPNIDMPLRLKVVR